LAPLCAEGGRVCQPARAAGALAMLPNPCAQPSFNGPFRIRLLCTPRVRRADGRSPRGPTWPPPPPAPQSFAPAKNDFLFERRLSDYVFGVVSEHSKGRPALVFCRRAAAGRLGPGSGADPSWHDPASLLLGLDRRAWLSLPRSSRNSTSETAQAIVKEAQQRRGPGAGPGGGAVGPGGAFVRGAAQVQRLQQAAAATKNKALQVRPPGAAAICFEGLSPPGTCVMHSPHPCPRTCWQGMPPPLRGSPKPT
jgi:hypothetical protein